MRNLIRMIVGSVIGALFPLVGILALDFVSRSQYAQGFSILDYRMPSFRSIHRWDSCLQLQGEVT